MKYLKRMVFLVMVMVMTAAVSKAAFAAPYFPKKSNMYKFSNIKSYYWEMTGVKSASDISDLKSSAPGVAAATVKTVSGNVVIDIEPKKAGKTIVSFSAKANGVTSKYKCTFTVKKDVKPFKKLKIGSTDYSKSFMSHSDYYVNIKKTLKKQKVDVTLKKGWKIRSITAWKLKDLTAPYKTLKNGKKVNIYKNSVLQFELEDPKGVQVIYYVYYR